jgi:hypothetical protein
MRRRIRIVATRSLPIALALMLATPPLPRAQQAPPQAPPPPAAQPAQAQQPGDNDVQPFKPEELEAIVAPIALYPDPLVAQVLMASTYPLEVIQAARLMKSNANLKDQALNDELKKYDWDDSVKSLCSFPQTLELLNEKIDWMQKLGDAFLDQRKDTMDAIQRMRAKAQAQGNLQSNEQQKVIVEAAEAAPGQPAPPAEQTVIKIEPANPQVIYVPQYNPTVVYGAYPPAYPYPPYYPYPPGYAWGAAALSFGVGMAVGAAVWGGCNWGGGDVNVNVNKANNFTNNVNSGNRATQVKNQRGSGQGGSGSWNHDPSHRKGAQYRGQGSQQKYGRGNSPQAGTRDAYRGRGDQGGARGGGPSAGTREAGGGQRGGATAGTREAGGQRGGATAGTREAGGPGAGGGGQQRGGGREAGAFEGGMGSGRDTRASSQRGQSSVGSSRASGYSGGGGGSRAGGGGSSGGGGGGGAARGGGGGGGGGGRGGGGGGRR